MADLFRKVGWLIEAEAYRQRHDHPEFLTRGGRVNGRALAEFTGISQPTISRLLRGKPSRRPGSGRRSAPYEISPAVMAGLKRLLGTNSRAAVFEAVEQARPRPRLVANGHR